MRITMNIEDDRGQAPEVKVETASAALAQTADHGDVIDAGPPAFDQALLTTVLDDAEEGDVENAGLDADNADVMGNGAHAGDMNDGGAAPTSIPDSPDDSDDSLLH
jgi:hypothetical protein